MTTKSEKKTQQSNKKARRNLKRLLPIIIPIVIIVISIVIGCILAARNTKQAEDETNHEVIEDVDAKQNDKVDLGEQYVDLENRIFAIDGKSYTLGKSTLQEMIDNGVTFDEEDIKNAGNNLNKNHESESFAIHLGKSQVAQVRVINNTDESQKIVDCKLAQIYFPVVEDRDQDVLQFAFPLTLSIEELKANAGEPTNQSNRDTENGEHSDKLEYKVDSEKYYGTSGYTFEFMNGKLRYVTINYK